MTSASYHTAVIAVLTSLHIVDVRGVAGVSVLPSVTGITEGRVLEIGLSILVTILVLISLIIG
jgi:hypothetical protein